MHVDVDSESLLSHVSGSGFWGCCLTYTGMSIWTYFTDRKSFVQSANTHCKDQSIRWIHHHPVSVRFLCKSDMKQKLYSFKIKLSHMHSIWPYGVFAVFCRCVFYFNGLVQCWILMNKLSRAKTIQNTYLLNGVGFVPLFQINCYLIWWFWPTTKCRPVIMIHN